MAITLHADLIVAGRMKHASFEIDAASAGTVKALLAEADQRELMGRGFFKELLSPRHRGGLTVLHNGRRLAVPGGLGAPLADGDEVNLLMPMAGG